MQDSISDLISPLRAIPNTLFADKLVQDDREPMATFELQGTTFGVWPPQFGFWKQLAMLLQFQIAMQAMFAAVIYRLIVQKRNTISAFLIGFSTIIPFSMYIPYVVLEAWDIQNKTLKLSLVTVPTVVVFRTIEALYGTSPRAVETNMGTYMVYYTSIPHFVWDVETAKRKKISTRQLLGNLGRFTLQFHILSILLSFAVHVDFKPFSSNVELSEYHLNWDLLEPGHLGNTYLLAVLVFLVLNVGFTGAALGDNLKGYQTKPTFLNPLFASRSPTDFWSRRWNMTIKDILMHSIYLPSRSLGMIPSVALTFLASGFLHDYTWTLIFYHHNHMLDESGVCRDGGNKCFSPIFFKVSAFFLWNGVIMILERQFFAKHKVFGFMKSWPSIVVSLLVTLLALPVSHWYTGDWAVGGYLADFGVGLWSFREITSAASE